MIEFNLPFTSGEWYAFIVAVLVMLIGVAIMVAPRPAMGFLGLAPDAAHPEGVSEIRAALGGLWAGLGLAAILLAQPLVYIALGLALAFAVIGRIISIVADGSFGKHCVAATVLEAACAFFPLAYGLQIIP